MGPHPTTNPPIPPPPQINDGASIDRMGLSRQRLARLSVESYLQQILRHGFFHVSARVGALMWGAGGEGSLGWIWADARRQTTWTQAGPRVESL